MLIRLMLCAAMVVGAAGCGGDDPDTGGPLDPPEPIKVIVTDAADEDLQAYELGQRTFAANLFGQLRQREGNVVFSPYSVYSALAMTYAGAKGDTADQIKHVLQLPLADVRIHNASSAFIHKLAGRPDKQAYTLLIANRLWGQQGVPFRDDFLDITKNFYGAKLQPVDFINAPDQARQMINRWTAQQTGGHIPELIGPGVLSDQTRLVLTNALYFKSDWQHQFEADDTWNESFYLDAASKVQVPMMHQTDRFGYRQTDDAQVLHMPYLGRQVACYIVLPKQRDGLDAVQRNLSERVLAGVVRGLSVKEVRLILPKFKLRYATSLKQSLTDMGMADAFDAGKADFSGALDGPADKQLFVADVLHEAFIEVDEEGTEAAAAAAVLKEDEAKEPEQPVEFRVDHPFIFLIRHRGTGAILFMGRVMDPRG